MERPFYPEESATAMDLDMGYNAAVDAFNQGFVDDFNWVEASVWLVVAACFLIHVLRHRRPLPKLALVAGLLFLLFGISDIVETRTGAWWRPWWLGAWKASCIFGFFMAYGRYRPTPPDEAAFDGRLQPAILTGIALGIVFAFMAWLRFDSPIEMNGPMDYYHLAVTRLMAAVGAGLRGLHWARFSQLGDEFADSEWMYHLLLWLLHAPTSPSAARLASAITNGAVLGTLAFLTYRWIGRAGLVVPIVVLLTLGVPSRLILNPDMAAGLLLLLAAYLTGRGALWALAAVGVLMALISAQWHWFLVLYVVAFVWQRIRTGQSRWGLVGFPAIGLLLGVSIHPAFPNNVALWMTSARAGIAMGEGTDLIHPFFLALGAICLMFTARSWRVKGEEQRNNQCLLATALASLVIMVQFRQAAPILIPVVVVASIISLFTTYRQPRSETRSRGRAVLATCVTVASVWAANAFSTEARLARVYVPYVSEGEIADLSQQIPAGSNVTAPWNETPLLAYAAPQANYLNLLSPAFMQAYDPRLVETEKELFAGRSQNPEQVVRSLFKSDYVAFSPSLHPELARFGGHLI